MHPGIPGCTLGERDTDAQSALLSPCVMVMMRRVLFSLPTRFTVGRQFWLYSLPVSLLVDSSGLLLSPPVSLLG